MACIASSVSGLTISAKAASPRRGSANAVAANGVNPAKGLSGARSAVMGARVQSAVAAKISADRSMSVVAMANPRGNSGGSRKGLSKFVERVNAPQMKDDLIPFRVGMTVKVGVTVIEGGKSRVQPYEGVLIAIHRAGVATTITVRKSFQGYGVERIFPIHSPLCTFEEIRGAGKPVARRAKLYYLRDLVGKKAKLKTKFVAKKAGATRHELKMDALAASKAEAAAAVEAAAKAEEEAAAAAAKAEEEAAAAAAKAEEEAAAAAAKAEEEAAAPAEEAAAPAEEAAAPSEEAAAPAEEAAAPSEEAAAPAEPEA